jgi:multidrug efflux pump subunit AcrB
MLQGLVLVGIVVLLAVGFRASIIVMLVIPFSIFIGVGALDFSGYGLQQMSIVGLVIALGLLVDNAIVVTENIARFMKLGYNAFEAAVKGTSQIAWAIVSSTLTTLLAFVPIIMMQNVTGDFIRSMPLTVVFTLTASLLLSLTLTPYLSSKFIKIESKDNGKESRLRKALNRLIETKYRRTLDVALSKPKTVVVISVIVFFASLTLFPVVGVSFFPKAEKEMFLINVQTPEGTSLDYTDKVVREVEKSLNKNDFVSLYAANVGHGNPRVYYNMVQSYEKQNFAMLFVELNTRDREIFDSVINDLRNEFDSYQGAKIEVKEFEQGPPVAAPIEIRIIGENLDVLKKISKDVEDMFESSEGTVNINNPLGTSKTDLRVNINRAKAGMLGVQIAEIDKTVRAAVAGLNISKYRDEEGKEYNIILRLPVNKKTVLEDFDKVYISSVNGSQVPLKQVASLQFESSPMKINHYNLERNVTITSDVISGYSVNAVTKKILNKLKNYDWPRGYNYYAAGELESRQESFGGMLQAIIIAMVGIFGVLVLQFKSYSQPLIVYSAIPLAIVGSVLALFITGYSFSFTAFVGITSLVGIVVNNSILLVDCTNQLRREGKEILEALKIAGETRFIPIILTTATTVGGLVPLTLGGGTLWAPMGWTIIGGLLVSTILTLVVVPVLYKIYTPTNIS